MLDVDIGYLKKEIKRFYPVLDKIRAEASKAVVGQQTIINSLLRGLLANGNVLIEGVPGTAKTLIIRTISKIIGCKFSRIQFTVDLLPADITGITIYDEKKGFYTIKGPVFANFVMADEINRAPAKTQSALIEAMQERQVTIGKKTYELEDPFFVMATQNPLESEGTYNLPEAQIDRFLFKVLIGYPKPEEEKEILTQNMNLEKFEDFNILQVVSSKQIVEMQNFVKKIYIKDDIKDYIVKIIEATRKPREHGISLGGYIEWGASPRASISLFIAAKTEALLNNSYFVTPQHIKNIVHDVLRHRLILNYEGQAEGIKSDHVIDEILSKIPVP
ncbi:MAG: MoxR family ATPase [Nanoarchaeota archaeon]|nr:MoxR family ATPase [Nanoarchaeota archaeon]